VQLLSAGVMLSSFGWLSGAFLNAPRFPVALVEHGDSPEYLGGLHPRFGTPHIGIVLYATIVFLLAWTGSFVWIIEVTAGAVTIYYSIGCLALFRLRHLQPSADVFHSPCGRLLATLGALLSIALISQLEPRQLGLMGFTCVLAAANWAWARGRRHPRRSLPPARNCKSLQS
jgi:basic amino acid/polyamine antiporter, APA family